MPIEYYALHNEALIKALKGHDFYCGLCGKKEDYKNVHFAVRNNQIITKDPATKVCKACADKEMESRPDPEEPIWREKFFVRIPDLSGEVVRYIVRECPNQEECKQEYERAGGHMTPGLVMETVLELIPRGERTKTYAN